MNKITNEDRHAATAAYRRKFLWWLGGLFTILFTIGGAVAVLTQIAERPSKQIAPATFNQGVKNTAGSNNNRSVKPNAPPKNGINKNVATNANALLPQKKEGNKK